MPVAGGPEEVILDRVWFAKWSVTVNGIAFLRPEQGHDVIELYDFSTRSVRRLGRLPFRVVHYPEIGHLSVSQDGRFAVTSVIERADSNLSLVDDFR
jgi:hypothetical protein